MAVPWLQIIKHAPTILSLSRDLLQRTRQTAPPPGADGQLQALAADLQKQAEVLHELAAQMEGMTTALAALRRAVVTALTISAVAGVIGIAALVLALAR